MKYLKASSITAALLLLTTGTTTALAADGGEYKSNGVVEFVANPEPTSPIDPTNPDPNNPVKPVDPTNPNGPNPGTAGPLSIDFASSLDFGKNKITNKDETYFANAQELEDGRSVPNYVQISDQRGSNAGWTLTVKQEGQLSNDATQNKELTGAEIKLGSGQAVSNAEAMAEPTTSDITLDPSGAVSKVMTAKAGAGAGTWVDRFGTVETVDVNGESLQKNKAVTLTVPGKTPKDAVKYKTELTWTLSDVPGNE